MTCPINVLKCLDKKHIQKSINLFFKEILPDNIQMSNFNVRINKLENFQSLGGSETNTCRIWFCQIMQMFPGHCFSCSI